MTATLHMLGRGRRSHAPFIAEDPRFLILSFVVVVVAAFLIDRAAGLILLLAYLVALLVIAGAPMRRMVIHVRTITVFVVVIVGVNAFFVDGRPLPGVLSSLSYEGVAAGLYYSLRVLVLFTAMVFLLDVTPPESMAAGIASIVRPMSPSLAGRVGLHAFVVLGFLPLFAAEIERIKAAQSFRGGWVGGGVARRMVGVRLLVVPLVVSAVHRSAQLAMAVEVRRIGQSIGRILDINGPRSKDVVFAVVTAIVLMCAVLL